MGVGAFSSSRLFNLNLASLELGKEAGGDSKGLVRVGASLGRDLHLSPEFDLHCLMLTAKHGAVATTPLRT